MAVKNQPPISPWPWGGQRTVQERKVQPGQVDRRKRAEKKGDPRNPPLASFELLDFIGPGHTSEELRLPPPPLPPGHDADVEPFYDRPHLKSVADRGESGARQELERALAKVNAPPDRLDRLKALLGRESQMLELVAQLSDEVEEIMRRVREEQQSETV